MKQLHPRSTLNEEDIDFICAYLQFYPNKSIQYVANVCNVGYYCVREIYNGRTWQWISNQYDFSERKRLRGKT